MRRDRGNTRKIDPESTDRTEKKLIWKVTNEIRERTNTERARKRVSRGLRLCTKLRQVRKIEVGAGKGNIPGDSLELPDMASSSQGNQKQNLLSQVPQ